MKPLQLDLSNSRVIIFGAGAVGRRKAQYFADAKAKIEFVTRTGSVPGPIFDVAKLSKTELQNLTAPFDFVIAALPDASLNEKICNAAADTHKFYNSATGPGNFLIPAAFSDGEVTVAVSAGAKSPALAAHLRNEIASEIKKQHPNLGKEAELHCLIRTELKRTEPDAKKRGEIMRRIAEDTELKNLLPDLDAALKRAKEKYYD